MPHSTAELRHRAQAIIAVNRQGATDAPDPDAVDAMLADAVALAEGVLATVESDLPDRIAELRGHIDDLFNGFFHAFTDDPSDQQTNIGAALSLLQRLKYVTRELGDTISTELGHEPATTRALVDVPAPTPDQLDVLERLRFPSRGTFEPREHHIIIEELARLGYVAISGHNEDGYATGVGITTVGGAFVAKHDTPNPAYEEHRAKLLSK